MPLHRLLFHGGKILVPPKEGLRKPEDVACENFKPKIKGPLDKYI